MRSGSPTPGPPGHEGQRRAKRRRTHWGPPETTGEDEEDSPAQPNRRGQRHSHQWCHGVIVIVVAAATAAAVVLLVLVLVLVL